MRALGACDAGEQCDGAALECPQVHEDSACGVTLVQKKKLVVATCSAPKLDGVANGETGCEGEGVVAEEGSTSTLGARTAGQSVIDLVRKPLKAKKRATTRTGKIKLRLNAAGKQLLRDSSTGAIDVRVTVRIRPGDGDVGTVTDVRRFAK